MFACLSRAVPGKEAAQLCELLSSGTLKGCKRLDLRGNCFRPRDVEDLKAAVAEGIAKGLVATQRLKPSSSILARRSSCVRALVWTGICSETSGD